MGTSGIEMVSMPVRSPASCGWLEPAQCVALSNAADQYVLLSAAVERTPLLSAAAESHGERVGVYTFRLLDELAKSPTLASVMLGEEIVVLQSPQAGPGVPPASLVIPKALPSSTSEEINLELEAEGVRSAITQTKHPSAKCILCAYLIRVFYTCVS